MTREEAMTVLREVFHRIAPDKDLAAVDATANLREELDIDSMDTLNATIAIAERTGVDIPEADYELVETLDGLIAYLVARSEP